MSALTAEGLPLGRSHEGRLLFGQSESSDLYGSVTLTLREAICCAHAWHA